MIGNTFVINVVRHVIEVKNMSRNVTAGSTGGVSFVGLLQVAFIVLKLCDVIDWSWLWVLSPMWISFFVALVVILLMFVWMKKH